MLALRLAVCVLVSVLLVVPLQGQQGLWGGGPFAQFPSGFNQQAFQGANRGFVRQNGRQQGQLGQGQFQGQGQSQFQGQGQGQGQFQGQGQSQFQGQGQGQGQGQFQGQGQGQFQGQGQGQQGVPWQEVFPSNGNNNNQGSVPWQEVGGGQQGNTGGTGSSRPGGNTGCSCVTTSEYNPVCGSDNATYSNPGRLSCAQRCQSRNGNRNTQPVQLIHYGVCRTNPERG